MNKNSGESWEKAAWRGGKNIKDVLSAPPVVLCGDWEEKRRLFCFFIFVKERERSIGRRMTEKAQQILNKMRENDRKRRALSRLSDPKHRTRLLDAFNKSTLDDGATPVGNSEMNVLKEMNDLEQDHERYIDSLRASKLGLSGIGD